MDRTDTSEASRGDRIKSALLYPLPHHTISRVVHSLVRWRLKPWTQLLIRLFRHAYRPDLEEAAEPEPRAYPSFNAFFTRALKPDARPMPTAPDALVCPADGTVSQLGSLRGDRMLQAKGHDYSMRALLGDDRTLSQTLAGGSFLTVYLAPRDYHRVHMPAGGTVTHMLHVPGRLFSVAPHTVRAVPGLFARNERVVAGFEGPHGVFALVLVGAICVASIEIAWAGEVTPPAGRELARWDYRGSRIALARGEEMGRFNMGSTVIALFPPGMVTWGASLAPGSRVRMGQAVGRYTLR